MEFLIYFATAILPIFSLVDFIYFLVKGERLYNKGGRVLDYLILCIPPAMFLLTEAGAKNECCYDSAFFSPDHKLSIYVIIILCLCAFFYCSRREKVAPPLTEIIVNCLLLTGIALNVVMMFQHPNDMKLLRGLIGNMPIIFSLILMLVKNHRMLLANLEGTTLEGVHLKDANLEGSSLQNVNLEDAHLQDANMANANLLEVKGTVGRFCLYLLKLHPLVKTPILLVLCLPLLVCVAAVLLLVGQKPDSLVRAFTDTYKHGLSQIDDQCNGVVCGGHFLCTIAAKGNPSLVKPIRAGVRAGAPIKCNRQLLVSNAFEEWLEDHLPAVHRPVRRLYNRVGNLIHRHYGAFDRKWVSNTVYILMKPLEWIFLLVLYMGDRAPETRIAQQYLSRADRQALRRAQTLAAQ